MEPYPSSSGLAGSQSRCSFQCHPSNSPSAHAVTQKSSYDCAPAMNIPSQTSFTDNKSKCMDPCQNTDGCAHPLSDGFINKFVDNSCSVPQPAPDTGYEADKEDYMDSCNPCAVAPPKIQKVKRRTSRCRRRSKSRGRCKKRQTKPKCRRRKKSRKKTEKNDCGLCATIKGNMLYLCPAKNGKCGESESNERKSRSRSERSRSKGKTRRDTSEKRQTKLKCGSSKKSRSRSRGSSKKKETKSKRSRKRSTSGSHKTSKNDKCRVSPTKKGQKRQSRSKNRSRSNSSKKRSRSSRGKSKDTGKKDDKCGMNMCATVKGNQLYLCPTKNGKCGQGKSKKERKSRSRSKRSRSKGKKKSKCKSQSRSKSRRPKKGRSRSKSRGTSKKRQTNACGC